MDSPVQNEKQEDLPMALIIEDDSITQTAIEKELAKMNFRYRKATTVTEAKNCYLELEKEGIPATIIGKATEGNDRVLLNEDEKRFLEPPKTDELYEVMED